MIELTQTDGLLLVDGSNLNSSDRRALFAALRLACIESNHSLYHILKTQFSAQNASEVTKAAMLQTIRAFNNRHKLQKQSGDGQLPSIPFLAKCRAWLFPAGFSSAGIEVLPRIYKRGTWHFTVKLSGTRADFGFLADLKAAAASPSCLGVRVKVRGTKVNVSADWRDSIANLQQAAVMLAKDTKFETARLVCPLSLWISYQLADGQLAAA